MAKSKFTQNSIDTWKDAWKKKNLSSSIGSVFTGATGIADSFMSNNEIKDTSEEEAAIDATGSTQFGSGSYDNLLSSFSTMDMAATNYTAEDVRGLSAGQMAGNTLKGVGSGAVAGAQIGGPWGAVIGGAVGLLGGLGGIFSGNKKARDKANELNLEAKRANEQYLASFENAASNTHNTMFNNSLLNMAARGGKLYIQPKRVFNNGGLMHQHGGIFSNGISFIDNGGTHEQNPFEGVQIGVDAQGIPNMVEEGEVIWQDYVFSNRLQPSEEFKKKYKVKGKTFADVAKELQKESEERPNDPISKNGLEDSMTKLMTEQENIRSKEDVATSGNMYGFGSWLKKVFGKSFEDPLYGGNSGGSGDDGEGDEEEGASDNFLRYAPVLGSALGVTSDLFGITNKPDYSNVNLIQDATDRFTPIDYTPIGTYLSYNPFDKNFYSSRIAEQAGATRRAITNQAINPGAAMSGLLAADYNAQTQLGGLFRQAEEYNQTQRERVAGFNRQTDAMNSEMAMKAAIANQGADELRLKSAITQAQMREQADATASAAKSANLTNMFDNLGAIGKENFIMDMLERNPALLYNWLGEYKGKACGGKINRRRRK